MESELFKTFISQGSWAILFVWLLIDTRKESKLREDKQRDESKLREDTLQNIINKNQEVIQELAERFEIVSVMQEDVNEIKAIISTNMIKGKKV